jgi:hypothetical protein
MRAIVIVTIIVAVIAMAAQTQALDWDTLSVNQNPVPPQATVSFSIGYPKGWHVFQDYGQETCDIYFDVPVPVEPNGLNGLICSFNQPATTNTLKEQGFVSYSIWASGGATAKEAAEKFFTDKRTASAYTQKSLKPVNSRAGEPGWLVENDGYVNVITDPAVTKLMTDLISSNAVNEYAQLTKKLKPNQEIQMPIVYHDFFFHSGRLGAIRIEIMTQAANKSWRSQLDRLVLETLQLSGA